MHYWADVQSVHGLRCYGNITQMRNVSEYMPALALCLVLSVLKMEVLSGSLPFKKRFYSLNASLKS